MTMYDHDGVDGIWPETEALGELLGVVAAHGMTAIRDAIAALREGRATRRQQVICWQVLKSVGTKYGVQP